MNLQQLTAHASAAQLDELTLVSIEGGIYLLQASLHGKPHLLKGPDGKVLHLRSVEHARDVLKSVPEVPFYRVDAVVHGEMCGVPDGGHHGLRVPISLRSAW